MQVVCRNSRVRRAPGTARRFSVPLLFVCLGLAAGSSALTLGDLQVGSTLGEPFSGIVRVDAGAGEVLRRECFSPGSGLNAVPGVPVVEDVRFRLDTVAGTSYLRIQSNSPVREPLAQVVLQVRCPGLPRLTRAFVLLLDPSSVAQMPTELLPAAATFTRPRAARAGGNQNVAGDIAPGSRYTVRPGDTLSGIASRIDGRPSYSVWALAGLIKAANPAAFENGRADRLIAATEIDVPYLESLAISSFRPAAPARDGAATAKPTAIDTPAANPATEASVVASSRSSRSIFDLPVLLGEPVSNADLEYLVLTPALSSVSRERIKKRVTEASGANDVKPAPQPDNATETNSTEPLQEETDAGFGMFAYIALGLLLLVGAGALVFLRRRETRQDAAIQEHESPWELDEGTEAPGIIDPALSAQTPGDLQAGPPSGMVYDDFEGTFVSIEPVDDSVNTGTVRPAGQDPEEDVQTHLMPSIADGADNGHARARHDFDEARQAFKRMQGQGDATGEISVTALDDNSNNITDDGWVELDFEATQILEQDYLAEYAATLREKIQQQNAERDAHESETEEDYDEVPLILAHEMLSTPEDDQNEPETIELATDSDLPTQSMPVGFAAFEDSDETVSLSLTAPENASDDNVVAIDKGKKSSKVADSTTVKKSKGGEKS